MRGHRWYITRDGYRWFYIDTLSGGTWTAARAPLPADAARHKGASPANTFLAAIACARPGACVVSGQYQDASGAIRPVILTLSGGTWRAVTVPLPIDKVSESGPANQAFLELASCPAASSCLTVGSYVSVDGTREAVIETATSRTP